MISFPTHLFSIYANICQVYYLLYVYINTYTYTYTGFPGGTSGKEPACQCRRIKRCRFDLWVGKILLEEGMATHSSILAWRIPWTEEPGGLLSVGVKKCQTQLK